MFFRSKDERKIALTGEEFAEIIKNADNYYSNGLDDLAMEDYNYIFDLLNLKYNRIVNKVKNAVVVDRSSIANIILVYSKDDDPYGKNLGFVIDSIEDYYLDRTMVFINVNRLKTIRFEELGSIYEFLVKNFPMFITMLNINKKLKETFDILPSLLQTSKPYLAEGEIELVSKFKKEVDTNLDLIKDDLDLAARFGSYDLNIRRSYAEFLCVVNKIYYREHGAFFDRYDMNKGSESNDEKTR